MAHQHFYSRVPARVSLYNKRDGFDTFAHSEGLDREFILGELSVMYQDKLDIHNPVRLRRGEIPRVYSQAMLPSGRPVQTVITYLPKDFTGERSAYLAHSLVMDENDIKNVFCSNGFDSFNTDMFIKDISAFDLTARNAGANPGLPDVNYVPRILSNGKAIMSQYSPEMVKSFIFSVIAAILGEDKNVYLRLPFTDSQLSDKAFDFITAVMSLLPYSLRQKLSFVTYVSDCAAYQGFNIKCLSSDCKISEDEDVVIYDFASGEIHGLSDKLRVYQSYASFLYSLLEYRKIREAFHVFVDGIEQKYPELTLDIKNFTDMIFMFWQCSGFYTEESVVANDDSLCNFLDIYAKFREGLEESYRVKAYRPFGRDLREQLAIPDGVFTRLSRLYPTECVAAKAVALDFLLGLIHVDIMRERIFAFISRNYAGEIDSVKAIINSNLCRVFYGGFLQQRILRHFDIFFNTEPTETKDFIIDKLLLSIRTPEIQEQIISFIDRHYIVLTTAQKLKICTTCHEMIPECDRLAVMLVSFVNRRIALDPDIARILAAGLCQSIDKSIDSSNPDLIRILINEFGFAEDVAIAHIVGSGRGMNILVNLMAEMPAKYRIDKLIRAAISVPGITEIRYDELLSGFKNVAVRVEPSTMYDIIEADKAASLSLSPAALVSLRENLIYPAIKCSYLDAFKLDLGKDGLEVLKAYVAANLSLADSEEYRVILAYLRMVELCQQADTENAFNYAIGMPDNEDIRADIGEHLQYFGVGSENDVAECTHKLLVSYFSEGKFAFDELYLEYYKQYEDDLIEKSGILSKISNVERRAAAKTVELILGCAIGICETSNALAAVACDDECGLKRALNSFADSYGFGAMGMLKKRTDNAHFAICDVVEALTEERKSAKR